MTRRAALWAMAATVFVVLVVAAYVGVQYKAAQKPSSLDALPQYPFIGSAYPLDDLAPADRDRAEAALRQFAGSFAPGYRPTAERFLAAQSGDFIWDAVRSSVGGYLSSSGFHVHDAGQKLHTSNDVAYIVWERTNRVQRVINPRQVLAVALQDSLATGLSGNQPVHVYAYFELTPVDATALAWGIR